MMEEKTLKKRKALLFSFFSAIMAVCREASEFLFKKAEHVNFSHWESVLTIVLGLSGYFILFLALMFLLDLLLFQIRPRQAESVKTHSSNWFYMILALGWLPAMVVKYPGAMNYDTWRTLWEYRSGNMTQHHSVFYSVLIGLFVNTGEKFGSANMGLFLFCVLHYIVYVFSFGYSLKVLQDRFHPRRALLVALTLSYLLNPYICGYIGVALKDSFYSVWLFALTICLVELNCYPEEFVGSKCKVGLLILSVLNVWLLRKNGPYILIFVTVILIFKALGRQKTYKKGMVIMLVACVISFGTSKLLNTVYDAEPGSIAEALSLPFQQTARLVKYREEVITEEEKEIIGKVLYYPDLVYVYNPKIADSVKSNYLENNEALPEYFVVWIKQFFRAPQVYLEATLEQNYYLFLPEVENITLFRDFNVAYEGGSEVVMEEVTEVGYYEPLFSVPESLLSPQEDATKFFYLLHQAPILRILANVSVFTYLLLMMIAACWTNRIPWSLPLLPGLISVGFIFLGPTIYAHPRYMFPVIYTLPFLMAFISRYFHERQGIYNG